MNTKLLYLSLIEWIVDLIVGVLILFVTYITFRSWFKKRYEVEEDNLSFRILCSAILFATGYCISGALQPITSTFRLLQSQGLTDGIYVWECIKYTGIFMLIGLALTVISNFLVLVFYNSITKSVDELQEIANGKIGYAIFMGTILIIISIFIKDAYVNLLEAMVPYPDIPVLPR
jgi:hypothetical protein